MAEFKVGDRVRMVKDIWDDGQDHHPSGYVARKGDVVTVKEITGNTLLCAHDWVTDDRRFVAMIDEVAEQEGTDDH